MDRYDEQAMRLYVQIRYPFIVAENIDDMVRHEGSLLMQAAQPIAHALRAERARVRPAIEAALLYMDLYGPGDSATDQMLRAVLQDGTEAMPSAAAAGRAATGEEA